MYMVKTTGCVRLASTGGEARAFRQAMVEERDVKKKDVEIDPVELKSAKPVLLAFLNGLLEAVDNKEDFEMPEGLTIIDKEAKKAEKAAKQKPKPDPKKEKDNAVAKAVKKPAPPPAKKAAPPTKKATAKKAPVKKPAKKKGR
jgi:hypothetical protein